MSFKSDMLEELKSLIETFEKCDDNLSDAPNLVRCFFAAEDIAFAATDYNRLRGRSSRRGHSTDGRNERAMDREARLRRDTKLEKFNEDLEAKCERPAISIGLFYNHGKATGGYGIRSNHLINSRLIAQAVSNGGGHDRASGGPLTETLIVKGGYDYPYEQNKKLDEILYVMSTNCLSMQL